MTRTGFSAAFIRSSIAVGLAVFAGQVEAQSMTLAIRPRVGDTLSIRMDQLVEMTGTKRGDTARSLAMETAVFTRAVPTRRVRNGTVVLGIADSVVMLPRVKGGTPRTRNLGGRSTEMLIQPGGGVDILKTDPGEDDLDEFFGQMPAMLPDEPMFVRGKWTREMPVPLRGDIHGTGWVRTTFTFDSLSRSGDIAYISLKGLLSHERLKDETGERDANGTITGSIQLDRRLGWIIDSKVTIVLESTVHSAASKARRNPADAMQVRTKIVQRVRATAK
jgi:hypothetical protein